VKQVAQRMAGRLKRSRRYGALVSSPGRVVAPLGLLARQALSQAMPDALAALASASTQSLRRYRPRKVYGQLGGLEVRLAETKADIRRAQRLRYRVFYEEMAASPSFTAMVRRLDEDPYDAVCDHLLVTDQMPPQAGAWQNRRGPKVVGTYRLLRQEMAERGRGFYTQGEYDIAPLIESRPPGTRFLELGRSCVLEPYRTKRTVELLWHGLWTYVRENKIDVMIGCASFEGTDPKAHAMALSLLHHQSLAPPEWRCRAHADLHQPMDLIAKDKLDLKAALKAMPPLIKGYLRLGAYVGDGAVIDHQFGTTDVFIVMPVAKINPRYFGHFGAPDEVKCRVALEA
jgi:L-ornithine Nalpha-acyltransferase